MTNQTTEQSSREAFEKRMTDNGKYPRSVEKNGDMDYKLMATHYAWQEFEAGYQARQPEIDALNAEINEQCRIIGAGGERELALLAERERMLADIKVMKNAIIKGKELSSWVGSINWRGGENLQPWLDDLSAKMSAFDTLRVPAIAIADKYVGG